MYNKKVVIIRISIFFLQGDGFYRPLEGEWVDTL